MNKVIQLVEKYIDITRGKKNIGRHCYLLKIGHTEKKTNEFTI